MAIHIVKLAVGIEDVDHLQLLQTKRCVDNGILFHSTRNSPRRSDELINGGSIYWVIKNFIRVRQRIINVEKAINSKGRPICHFILDCSLIKTELKGFKPFQGWRYLRDDQKPQDIDLEQANNLKSDRLPLELEVELKNLGLI